MGFFPSPLQKLNQVINLYMMPLISFNSQIVKMAKAHWKEFPIPIKNFLWRNNTFPRIPWHWCSWKKVSSPKHCGGLGIIDLVTHACIMFENFMISLAKGQWAWDIMVSACLAQALLQLQGGPLA